MASRRHHQGYFGISKCLFNHRSLSVGEEFSHRMIGVHIRLLPHFHETLSDSASSHCTPCSHLQPQLLNSLWMCDLNTQMAYQTAQISSAAKISLQDGLDETALPASTSSAQKPRASKILHVEGPQNWGVVPGPSVDGKQKGRVESLIRIVIILVMAPEGPFPLWLWVRQWLAAQKYP